MKYRLINIFLLAILLAACTATPAPVSTLVVPPSPTTFYAPTLAPTKTPTPSPTATIEPTETAAPTPTTEALLPLDNLGPLTPQLAPHIPLETGILLPQETVTRPMSLEGGATFFLAQWQGGSLIVTLMDPNGQLIDPAYLEANPSMGSYFGEEGRVIYNITNALPGEWKIILEAGSDVPSNGSSYMTMATFESKINLAGGTNNLWYEPGATITIRASLSGSPTNAAVTAEILRPDGVTDSLPLQPKTAGEFEGAYTAPEAPGFTEVRFVANGLTPEGIPFERAASTQFQISPETAILNGTYSDAPDPLPSNPERYQTLLVMVGVESKVNGKLQLSGDLIDKNGNFVAHSLITADVVPGTNTLTLPFEGDVIYKSQLNGPYSLNVILVDSSDIPLMLVEVNNVYITASYDWEDFVSD